MGPNPNDKYPNPNFPLICYIKNAVDNPNVIIGDGAIIGANSVVSRDIEAYAIAVGNPCRVKKTRFTKQQIQIFEDVKWWDWDIEKIEANFPIIDSGDIEALKSIK